MNRPTRFSMLMILLFVPLFSMLSTSGYAQWKLGLSAGYTNNTLETSSAYFYDRNFSSSGGFSIALTGGYQFKEWVSLEADLSFMQKNYKTFRTNSSISYEHSNITNGYLNVPIYARFSFGGKKLRGFTTLGGYVGYWASGHIEGVVSNVSFNPGENSPYKYDEKYTFDSRRDNRFEAGLMGGLGVEYLFCNRYKVFLEGRYYYSLTDMQKKYMLEQMPRYNNTFLVQVGFSFRFLKATKQTLSIHSNN